MTTSPPPDPALPATPKPPSWRKRHPVLARMALYGGMVGVLGAGAWVGAGMLEESRQTALITKVHGAQLIRVVDPDRALRILREEVLEMRPNGDVRRRARLAEAAVLDFLKRYEEGDRAYAVIEADWPAGTPRGPLNVPWANLRISAGRPAEGLRLLDAPDATDGWPDADVSTVRARGAAELAAALRRPRAPDPASAGMSGGG